MKILNLPSAYQRCFELLSKRLGDKLPTLTVKFEECERASVGFDGEYGFIRCNKIHLFARLLGLCAENFKGERFEICEKVSFETVGCMLDLSFGSAPTLKSLFDFLEYTALLGYNQIWLYMEDMYEIKERPHFGYLRGR